ncbi:amidase [Inmirania thermothiophila]|uniref:Aspartyl-tRNA(Asn)/glutamyl-tRNA(Gln) amidotransferase subunit A n=1 Tax=Inmirania thermothiophila TaxID=1750597 RepID=A0A3N1Y1C4_9GAMM|nr:amidase family protein [Inmirania thermothiophila]ROR32351.1 aspartyl-tRNA(Asn)/glutamyl-tRNA(Gln) amidotransferase subunit A [Inmirania thermothiophila]
MDAETAPHRRGPAAVLVAALREGALDAAELAGQCLEAVAAREAAIGAWAFHDPGHVRRQAAICDELRREGRPLGPLHGLPVAVEDVFDTADMPTGDGSPLHEGRRPLEDAWAVRALRAAGAVLLGKAATAELGCGLPPPTRHPLDAARAVGMGPGGAAAALAAGMAPAALVADCAGSVVPAAAWCGVHAYRPSRGWIPRPGMLRRSRLLDGVAVLAAAVEDLALVAGPLLGDDPEDPDTRPLARPALAEEALRPPPLPPRFGLVEGPEWMRPGPAAAEGLAALAEMLGGEAGRIGLGGRFREAAAQARLVLEADLALRLEEEVGRGRVSPALAELVARGRRHAAVDYLRAAGEAAALYRIVREAFDEYDVLVAPAAAGEAPPRQEQPLDAPFAAPWTLLGMPVVVLPAMTGPDGLPMGVQLIAPRGDDVRLLRAARWLEGRLAATTEETTPCGT